MTRQVHPTAIEHHAALRRAVGATPLAVLVGGAVGLVFNLVLFWRQRCSSGH